MRPDGVHVLSAEDWAVFRKLRLRALADAPSAFGATLAQAEAHPESLWRDRVGGPGPTMSSYADGRAVALGGVFLPPSGGPAMVWGMWTAPEARGAGHAGRLLAALVAWCREHGHEIVLDVTEGNVEARRLYLAAGFRPTGEWEPLREGCDVGVETMRWHAPARAPGAGR